MSDSKKINILHLISGLQLGGAENMLYKLIKHAASSECYQVVVSMTNLGAYGEKLKELGVVVYCLNMTNISRPTQGFIKYRKIIKENNINLVHAWMYPAMFFTAFCGFFFRRIKTIWNIRSCLSCIENYNKKTQILIKLCGKLSRYPKYIVNNSKLSLRQHSKIGFSSSKSVYIPNGFDFDKFKPSNSIYMDFRKNNKMNKKDKIIACIGAYRIEKNQQFFIEVAKVVKKRTRESVKFLIAGPQCDKENEELVNIIKSNALVDDVILLGIVDSCKVLPAVDVYLSCSTQEGFPNIVGEAIACGVPAVVTNVGDCSEMVGSYGCVCPVNSLQAMADGCLKYICGRIDGEKGITYGFPEKYEIKSIVSKYECLYMNCVN